MHSLNAKSLIVKEKHGNKNLFKQIQQHQLMIIATDSNQLKPIVVDTLIYASGERYEFVLVANQSPG